MPQKVEAEIPVCSCPLNLMSNGSDPLEFHSSVVFRIFRSEYAKGQIQVNIQENIPLRNGHSQPIIAGLESQDLKSYPESINPNSQ